jgi:hypothetical protein
MDSMVQGIHEMRVSYSSILHAPSVFSMNRSLST